MSLTYSSYVSELATITVISSTILETGDANFGGIIPGAIDYAEGRIYRDLDIPAARITDTTNTLSSGVRSLTLNTSIYTPLSIETVNVFTPAGATSSNGTRVPLVPASESVVDAIYPSALSSNCGQPQFFARITDLQLAFGPTPDQGYILELTNTFRPAPLSASNSSTWLTQNVPELMIAASMVFLAGYMRDYGSQADDPKIAASWESQYQNLAKSANVDALRQKFEGAGWSAAAPSAIATPPRA